MSTEQLGNYGLHFSKGDFLSQKYRISDAFRRIWVIWSITKIEPYIAPHTGALGFLIQSCA